MRVCGHGKHWSAAVEIVISRTQNPPLATAYRFESGHRHQLVASAISLATSFFILFQNASRAHSAAPRFQIEPASLGFDLVSGANLGAGASILLRCSDFFQKPERAHAVAPPFQITTACAGLRFGFGNVCRKATAFILLRCSRSLQAPRRLQRVFHFENCCLSIGLLLPSGRKPSPGTCRRTLAVEGGIDPCMTN